MVASPVAVLAAVLVSPWFLCALAVPPFLMIVPELRLRDRAEQRREGVDGELPFLSVVVAVLGGAGVPLHSILEDLSGVKVFPFVRREALLVKRDVAVFGMSPEEALERVASSHPSKRFSDFLLGYTSKVRGGGDTPGYLAAESSVLLGELEKGWDRYVARVGVVGSIMVTAFGVVPLLLTIVGVFSAGFATFGLTVFAGVGVPLLTVALLRLAGRMQPVHEDVAHGRWVMSALIGVAGGVAGGALWTPWGALALSLFACFLSYGLSVKGQLSETRDVEEGLSLFLRDLMDYTRQEYDLARAVVAIEARTRYNSRFSELLSKVAAQLRAGVPLDQVRTECRSRLGNLVFLMLGAMSRSGGGTTDVVYQVSNFAGRLTGMRKEAAAETKPYLLLSYAVPILLAFGTSFVRGVQGAVDGGYRGGTTGLHLSGMQVGAIPPGMAEVSDVLIVVSAASLGLIGAKMMDLTAKNTLRAAVNVAIGALAIVTMAALGSRLFSQILLR